MESNTKKSNGNTNTPKSTVTNKNRKANNSKKIRMLMGIIAVDVILIIAACIILVIQIKKNASDSPESEAYQEASDALDEKLGEIENSDESPASDYDELVEVTEANEQSETDDTANTDDMTKTDDAAKTDGDVDDISAVTNEVSSETNASEKTSEDKSKNSSDKTADGETEWSLILVNKDNPIPDNYDIELTDLSNGEQVDSRIYPSLQEMFDDARSNGMDLFVREGYRTREDQQAIMDSRIEEYENEGNSEEDAINLAKQYVAEPGTSEHELGISVDINANNDVSSDDTIYTWLDENAYKYGFIKRYPEDKIDITGINNEPWHYRYVGKETAKKMKEMNLCLEEYLDYLKNNE